MPWATIPDTETEAVRRMQESPDQVVFPMQDQRLTLILKQKGNQVQVLPELHGQELVGQSRVMQRPEELDHLLTTIEMTMEPGVLTEGTIMATTGPITMTGTVETRIRITIQTGVIKMLRKVHPEPRVAEHKEKLLHVLPLQNRKQDLQHHKTGHIRQGTAHQGQQVPVRKA